MTGNTVVYGAFPGTPDGIEGSGGGPYDTNTEQRVTRLETHFEYVRKDLDEIKGTLATVASTTAALPTKADLQSWKLQWTGLAFVVVALIIGSVIGGLAWIKPEAPAPSAPQVIYIQPPSASASPPDSAKQSPQTK